MLGNFCANIHKAVGHNVIRINWLGDWGTQFGILLAGMEKEGLENLESLQDNPIRQFYEIYVKANKLAIEDEQFAQRAKTLVHALENGDPKLNEKWFKIREMTIEELDKTYARLDIHFDHFHGEAMYVDSSEFLLSRVKELGLLVDMPDGRKAADLGLDRLAILEKSDGTSLYLTRDCAAALDRKKTFNFNRMLYVVENSQHEHFVTLFDLLSRLGEGIHHEQLQHVKFGRIRGISTRKGTSVFLNEVLDEGRQQMMERQLQTPTTRDNSPEVADVLAASAIIINDFKQRRQKDYDFSWERALNADGDGGLMLHYTHARLTSLLAAKPHGLELSYLAELLTKEVRAWGLPEPQAMNLIFQIARFDEVVRDAYVNLEPCIIVQYLFALCNETSKALKVLPVQKAESLEEVKSRMALFAAARSRLAEGMELLGLTPLSKM